ncbi:hypothetical protein GCM10012275_47640 [Longimycelium tulufanense]|uniref:Uncharacterized protein n=1 Tax=Longimycelium tulufanense TaxID=907463 RepID=A0A8J3CJH0_9PSEU|nr:hypothetical protein [Longimycelium tulufanense]GGM71657.1 hypothetical protein GCM10012275_47640 [Longimycelium tulufanense]
MPLLQGHPGQHRRCGEPRLTPVPNALQQGQGVSTTDGIDILGGIKALAKFAQPIIVAALRVGGPVAEGVLDGTLATIYGADRRPARGGGSRPTATTGQGMGVASREATPSSSDAPVPHRPRTTRAVRK